MQHDELTRLDDSRDTAVVVATIIAVVLASVYWISRIGFDNPIGPVVNALGVSLFLIATPRALSRWAGERNAWWISQPAIAVWCLVAVTMAAMIAKATAFTPVAALVVAGIALAAWTLVRWVMRGTVAGSIGFIVAVSIFALWCAGVLWSSRYKMPLFWETLSLRANVHHDTFYYASMANMLDTYGVPSTGIDGIPAIRYHFGSPWLYAEWSHLLGTSVLTFYSLGYALIVVPLFFSAMLLFATEAGASLRNDWLAWLVLLAATVGFLPSAALYDVGVWNANAFISESYQIGLVVFFLFSGTVLAFWRTGGVATRRISDLVFLLLVVPLAFVALGLLKLSLMILSFAAGIYLLFRLRLTRRPVVLACALISFGAMFYTLRIVNLPAQNQGISLLDFMRFNNLRGWQQFFPLIHLLWTWVYLAARAWEEGVRDTTTLSSAVKSGRLIDAEVLAVVAVIGFLPGELIQIHGGSAIYFSDVQRWLAVSLVMARTGVWLAHRKPKVRKADGPVLSMQLSTVLLVFAGAPFAISFIMNLAQQPARVVRANLATRRDLITGSAYKPIVMALRDISALPRKERKQAALFIPQSNTLYWSMLTEDGRCTYTPLVAPAVASMAMIDGMPPFECRVTDQYNMTSYPRRTAPQTTADVTDAVLCAKARAKGFREVIVLGLDEKKLPHRRRIDCYLHSS